MLKKRNVYKLNYIRLVSFSFHHWDSHQSTKNIYICKLSHLTFHKVGMGLSIGTLPDLQGSALYQIIHNTLRTVEINSLMQFDWIPLWVIPRGHQWPLDENVDSRTKGKDREKSRMRMLTLLFLLRGQQQRSERQNERMNNGVAQMMRGHVSFNQSQVFNQKNKGCFIVRRTPIIRFFTGWMVWPKSNFIVSFLPQ